jgi:hypothetical protein
MAVGILEDHRMKLVPGTGEFKGIQVTNQLTKVNSMRERSI